MNLPTVRFDTVCAHCGEVNVDPHKVTLVLNAGTGDAGYEFSCPRCYCPNRTPASPATSEMLQGLGATVAVHTNAWDGERGGSCK